MLLPLLCLVITLMCFLDYKYIPKHAANEPPLVRSTVPYVGHIIGLLRHGLRYYQSMSAKCRLPIFSLPMLNGKVYVITSVELVNAVNRNSRTLAFNPFIAPLGKRITGHDEATSHVVQHNLNGENGPGYVTDIHNASVSKLSLGKELENMTKAMLQEAAVYFDKLRPGQVIDLFAWTKQVVTMCSTRAIYGPKNPFNQDQERLVKAFWDFDENLDKLIIDIVPNRVTPKGFRARAELGSAFEQYFEHYQPGEGAALVDARLSIAKHYKLTSWNTGRLEVGILLGILANTIPSHFYMLNQILADPELLRDVREEIERTSVEDTAHGKCLKIMTMREKCILLYSTLQEMLRLHALGASSRYVREDILLQDRYLLKKGMIVQMPMAVMHSDPAIWGASVNEFDARRFLKLPDKEFKTNATAYRPFGGGSSLCPGRHFVTLEAMALTASFVLRYDVEPVDGAWTIPAQKQESMATNVFPPDDDIRVEIRERQGYEGVCWDSSMT